MLRLFIGIGLPPQHRLALSVICQGLHGIRWVDAGNLHVTIRFIGEIDEGVAADVDIALAALRAPRFSLSIAGIDFFGPAEKPRLIYARLDREPALFTLRDRVETSLARVGLAPDGRRYAPHVTLGSCRAPNLAEIQEFIGRHNLLRLPSFPVESFCLIRSYLTKAGSVYEDVAEYRLR